MQVDPSTRFSSVCHTLVGCFPSYIFINTPKFIYNELEVRGVQKRPRFSKNDIAHTYYALFVIKQ